MSRPKKPSNPRENREYSSRETSSRRPSSGATARPSGTRSASSTRPTASKQPPRSSAQARSSTSRTQSAASRSQSTARAGSASRPMGSASAQRPTSSRPASGTRSQSTARAGSASRPISSTRPSAVSGGHRPPSRSGAPAQRSGSAASGKAAGASQTPNRRRPPKHKKMRLRWGRVLALVVVLLLCVKFVPMLFDRTGSDEAQVPAAQSAAQPLVSDADKPGFDETINSDSAILINVGNGDVLYEKDADSQRPPASLVKMMTVYVAIKNCDNLDRELQMPKAAFKGLEEHKASQSGLKAGETVTVRDLLYAAMLSSGGDAANALALITGGNIEGFVELMNEEADKLGLDSTTFKNPTGLDAGGQVSTCRDMARLVKGALGNTVFKEVFTAHTYTTTANDTHPEGLELSHTMSKDLNSFQRYFDTSGYEILGGKTGYTEKAGNCLVTMADKKKAPEFVVVTMHATGTGDQYYQAFHDAVTLYGEAYDQIKKGPVEKDGSLD